MHFYSTASTAKFNAKRIATTQMIGLTSLTLPVKSFAKIYVMKPAAIPYEIEYPSPINTEAKKAGIASLNSDQLISLNDESIIIPTIMRIGAVACVGTIASKGKKRLEIANITATTIEVSPVRPPAPIPAADST